MTRSRTFRICFLGSMLGSIAGVIGWAGVVGWRMWPEWRAVREMRRAVETNEPGRFLYAVEAVDQSGVAEAAADEIAPLCHHADPRVRMYAVMARTVLGPRGPSEARELIALFDDPDEDTAVRRAAALCLGLFGEHAREAIPSLKKAATDNDDPCQEEALLAMIQLGQGIVGRPRPPAGYLQDFNELAVPDVDATRREIGEFLVREAVEIPFIAAMKKNQDSIGSRR